MTRLNKKDIELHYKWLNHNSETEIRLIIDKSEQKNYPEKEWSQSFFFTNLNEIVDFCKKWNGKRHLYIGINQRKSKGTKIKDIEVIKNLVVDIDNKGDFFKTQDTALKIKEDSINQGFKEPLLVCSGNGFHLYFALEEIPNNEQTREQIKAFGKKLKQKYETKESEIDSAVFEPARVMRLAGTENVKPEVKTLCTIINKENKRENDSLLTEQILAIKPEDSIVQTGELETTLAELIEKEDTIKKLFNAEPETMKAFQSRSEAEISLVCRLVQAGLTKEQIFKVMSSCKIGKWQEASVQYRDLTYKKAIEIISKEKVNMQNKNPFKKLHYKSQHLKHFEDFNKLLGLYGNHYMPLKKARWYQFIGGIIQKPIVLGDKYTDTRLNCIYPLPTEQGKNDFIYFVKNIVTQVSKSNDETFTIEEPVSYHPEQLIGKVIEVMIDNPSGNKPKKIKVKQENRGYFNSDFVEIDEANTLITGTDEQTKIAREYISKALNPIGRNEVTKKLVEDLPDERVSYSPKCTFTLYYQPRKISEELILQGFLRRFLIPVGSVELFLNYGNEEDFKKKISLPEFSRQDLKEKIVKYLDNVRLTLKDKNFIFTKEASEKINYYHQYLIAEGQVHSEKIANLTKLFKWTFQDYLIKMSCILAGSFNTYIVDENFVTLAFMDLVELLQASFDFIDEWVIGNFDYNIAWKGANYKERVCLEFLYNQKCFSLETSNISISEFQSEIASIYGVKEAMSRKIFSDYKKKGWIDSKQTDSYETKVWLTFIPQLENLTFQGDKGVKGANIYESIVSSLNTILQGVSPLSPFTPTTEEDITNGRD